MTNKSPKLFTLWLPLLTVGTVLLVIFLVTHDSSSLPKGYTQTMYAFEKTVVSDATQKLDIRIGDEAKPDPSFTLTKWDGEVTLKMTPQLQEEVADASKSLKFVGDKIVFQNGEKEEVHMYDLPKDDLNPDGGYEIEWIMNSKPQSNVFNFSLETDGLEFLYQDSLKNELANNARDHTASPKAFSCTDTVCVDRNGKEVSWRPENVVGSYAVFAIGKKDNYSGLGGKNYGTGKVGHIYRPLVTDSKGNKIWAELHIDITTKLLTITVPQSFLDTATYPVIVDPTYGYTSLGATEDDTEACVLNYLGGSFAGATGSVISAGHWYGRYTSSATRTVYLGLYDGIEATISVLLDSISSSVDLTTSLTQYTITGTGSYAMTNGVNYGVAAASSAAGGWKNAYDSGGTTGNFDCGPTSLPATFGTTNPGAFNNRTSFYFDYTEPGGGAVTPVASSVRNRGNFKIRGGGTGFPTTAILDNFNRADTSPLGGIWTCPWRPGGSNLEIVSNQAETEASLFQSNCYVNTQTYGPDSEAYVTITQNGAADSCVSLMLRSQSPGTAGVDGYWFAYCPVAGGSNDTWDIFRVDNDTFSSSLATAVQELSSGDSIGASATGNVLRFYYKPSGGSWTLITTATDSTYPSAGYVALHLDLNDAEVDDFGGGSVGSFGVKFR